MKLINKDQKLKRYEDPYPHLEVKNFLDESFLDLLLKDYPSEEDFSSVSSLKSRATYNIYYTDEVFKSLIEKSTAWKNFYQYINSQKFLEYFLLHFKDTLNGLGYMHDPEKIYFEEYFEGRDQINHGSKVLKIKDFLIDPFTKNNQKVFTRLDLSLGGINYSKPPHADNENRLGAAVFYLNSADETGSIGGDFEIWDVKEEFRSEKLSRTPKRSKLSLQKSIPFNRNTALFFPCHARSFHSVKEVTKQKEKRKFLYLSLSFKSHNIWR